MQLVNGTSYHDGTPAEVIALLEDSRQTGKRLRIHYGDRETGRDWMDEHNVAGRVGRSTGDLKVPLLLANSRALGGGAIMDHWIVKIRASAGGAALYQHPRYYLPDIRLTDDPAERLPFAVVADGSVHARFATAEKRARWLARMGISLPAPHTVSPEASERWECPFCGERAHFVGHDDEGYPGEDCVCEASEDPDAACTCKVTLSQPLTVERDEDGRFVDIDYHSHVGGGSGAEIGMYSRIDCYACGREIWRENEGAPEERGTLQAGDA